MQTIVAMNTASWSASNFSREQRIQTVLLLLQPLKNYSQWLCRLIQLSAKYVLVSFKLILELNFHVLRIYIALGLKGTAI